MAGTLQMRRSRGAASGFLLVLLGAWGALIPFIGPYFHYAYTPDAAWTYNTARLWLEILPGAAVFLGGILLMIATGRHVALFGALLAAAAGAWYPRRERYPAAPEYSAPVWVGAMKSRPAQQIVTHSGSDSHGWDAANAAQ